MLRATRIAAARQGKRESDNVEVALRGYLGLGVLEEIWAQNPGDINADEAVTLAVDEQRACTRGRVIRAVVDSNVLIAAALAPKRPTRRLSARPR